MFTGDQPVHTVSCYAIILAHILVFVKVVRRLNRTTCNFLAHIVVETMSPD